MAQVNRDTAVVDARIVYWGIPGSGKTTNLSQVHAKLRPDHRGELREVPTRLDPTVSYEVLPIELGDIGGVRTQIQMVAVPGDPDQGATRKQLLDQVDGVVLVIDSQRDRIDENVASFEELRRSLGDYGRSLSDVPIVVQYNKRDLSDPYVLEELHRKLDLAGAAVFEAVATETTGVLQTLSTISKRVIRTLRDDGERPASAEPELTPGGLAPAGGGAQTVVDFDPVGSVDAEAVDSEAVALDALGAEPIVAEAPLTDAFGSDVSLDEPPLDLETPVDPEPPGLQPPPSREPTPAERMEQALLDEDSHPEAGPIAGAAMSAESGFEDGWAEVSGELQPGAGPRLGPDLSIVSVGEATRDGDRGVRVPLVLGDEDGRTSTLVLTIQLDPLVGEDES